MEMRAHVPIDARAPIPSGHGLVFIVNCWSKVQIGSYLEGFNWPRLWQRHQSHEIYER